MMLVGRKHLLGTVTDGDIRRCILRGIGLDQPVSAVMNSRPLTANLDQGRDAILRLMRDRQIHQIPLLDSGGRLVGLETLDELIQRNQVDVWVVLMAGGLGTRLRPLTENTPKPLLPILPDSASTPACRRLPNHIRTPPSGCR
jgi:CBS-domain-containing membrane protein